MRPEATMPVVLWNASPPSIARAATGINNSARISVVNVIVVATGAYANDHVVVPSRRWTKGDPHPFRSHPIRWRWQVTGRGNAESPKFVAGGAQSNIRALISSVRGRCQLCS
jgi:hypothetical protein